ncbi:MAG: hypothetical protein U0U70_06300 [Chitinophagaceae bacterium]
MFRSILLFLLSSTLLIKDSTAQDTIPLLKGKVKLSVTKGTIECDLTLSDIPAIEDYYIRLNSGMNIFYMKDLDWDNLVQFDKSFFDTMSTTETNAYYFGAGNDRKRKFLPKKIQFRYVGMFPVIPEGSNEYSAEDWKGNIAFNGTSVRVDGRQSAWYPVLYDIKNDQMYATLRYDIDVECADCSSIYVNGTLPVKGQVAHLQSSIPYELTMFCGKYDFSNIGGSYFLNPNITQKQLQEFAGITNSYKSFLQQKLNLPYKGNPVYIQTTPTSERNAWLFVSYPTIVNIGRNEFSMIKFISPERADWARPYIAHELGHYYFGTYKVFNSALGDMMSEGFSEYLAFKVTKNLIGDSIYKVRLSKKADMLTDFAATPFSKVSSKNDYNNRELYVYYYAPILFLAIEKEIGEEKMWKWLATILETKTVFTDYAFLRQTLRDALNNAKLADQIEQKYFSSDHSLDTALEKLGLK